jgi:hypothetical protein
LDFEDMRPFSLQTERIVLTAVTRNGRNRFIFTGAETEGFRGQISAVVRTRVS